MKETPPGLLRIDQAASRLSCSPSDVRRWIREGRLPALRIGERLYRLREADVAVFNQEASVQPQDERANAPRAELTMLGTTVVAATGGNAPTVANPTLPLPPELDPQQATLSILSAPPAEKFTVAFLIGEWLEDVCGRVRPKTFVSYEQMARLHILPILGLWRVDQLDIRTMERFFHYKYQSGLSARTVQYLRSLLRQAYNEAIRWGWLTRNVAALSRGPKAERIPPLLPSAEEAQRLFASLKTNRYGPLYTTALGLGLRLGETLGLRWSDVCLPEARGDKQEHVAVRVQLQRINGEFQLVPPKSRSSTRTLSPPAFVVASLIRRRDEQRAERLEADVRWRNELGLVFTNKFGGPLDESRVSQRFREHLARHGFVPMRFHDLRHLFASLLLAEGTHPRVLMELLGHSQISLTMNTYCHVMPGAHLEAARAMERALDQAAG